MAEDDGRVAASKPDDTSRWNTSQKGGGNECGSRHFNNRKGATKSSSTSTETHCSIEVEMEWNGMERRGSTLCAVFAIFHLDRIRHIHSAFGLLHPRTATDRTQKHRERARPRESESSRMEWSPPSPSLSEYPICAFIWPSCLW